ncbi:hypothetical protein MASR2M74_08130 [Paracoccaceae bacterium]
MPRTGLHLISDADAARGADTGAMATSMSWPAISPSGVRWLKGAWLLSMPARSVSAVAGKAVNSPEKATDKGQA